MSPDNPFGDPGDPQGENPTIQELRSRESDLAKQLKAAEKELGQLREFKAGADAEAQVAAAQAHGLSARQARTFLKEHEGDVTPEAVSAWKAELGLGDAPPAEQAEGEATPDAAAPQSGFSPLSLGGTPVNTGRLSYEQYTDLLKTNFAEAARAVSEGRVDGIYSNPQ